MFYSYMWDYYFCTKIIIICKSNNKSYTIILELRWISIFYILRFATKPFNVLLACTHPLIPEFASIDIQHIYHHDVLIHLAGTEIYQCFSRSYIFAWHCRAIFTLRFHIFDKSLSTYSVLYYHATVLIKSTGKNEIPVTILSVQS